MRTYRALERHAALANRGELTFKIEHENLDGKQTDACRTVVSTNDAPLGLDYLFSTPCYGTTGASAADS